MRNVDKRGFPFGESSHDLSHQNTFRSRVHTIGLARLYATLLLLVAHRLSRICAPR